MKIISEHESNGAPDESDYKEKYKKVHWVQGKSMAKIWKTVPFSIMILLRGSHGDRSKRGLHDETRNNNMLQNERNREIWQTPMINW